MAAGVLAALTWLARGAQPRPAASGWRQRLTGWLTSLGAALDDALPVVLVGLAIGRIVFVLAQWEFFAEHTRQALRVWEGGLSAQGTAAGALLILGWQDRRAAGGSGGGARLERFVAPFLIMQTAAWLGCALAGCAYGRPLDLARWPALARFDWPDLYGVFLPRIPVQGLGVLFSLALLGVSTWLQRRPHAPGLIVGLALLLGGLGDGALQLLRGDEAWFWWNGRAALWADGVFALLGACWLVRAWRQRLAQNLVSC